MVKKGKKYKKSIIENAFRKEIGISIHRAMNFLNEEGITPEILGDITDKLKKTITDEIEIRDIPYEYRFLMINVILYTMFDIAAEYHKKFIESIMDIESTEIEDTDEDMSISTFINKKY